MNFLKRQMVLLNNPQFFRYGFFVLMVINLSLHYSNLQDIEIYFVYSLTAIFLGMGFYNKPLWFLLVVSFLSPIIRVFPSPGVYHFLLLLGNYLLTVFISAGLMKNYQKVKNDNLELTKSLSNALDSRDKYTLNHSENVAQYAMAIAQKMKLSESLCDSIYLGGLLHDIGKIGIPEDILKKPSRLTNEEYKTIQTHPEIGFDMIKHVSYFKENGILDIILHHHERYDGNGYPRGLRGEEIPLPARIVGVADAFDAMTSKRVYRQEVDIEAAMLEVANNRGKQFDPVVVDAFLSLYNAIDHGSGHYLEKSS